METLSPGMEIVFSGCIPACGDTPVDAYLICFSPSGEPYSIVYSGLVVEGFAPYASAVYNPSECYCMEMWTHTICQDPPEGIWKAVLALLPHGAKADAQNVITYTLKTVTIVR